MTEPTKSVKGHFSPEFYNPYGDTYKHEEIDAEWWFVWENDGDDMTYAYPQGINVSVDAGDGLVEVVLTRETLTAMLAELDKPRSNPH